MIERWDRAPFTMDKPNEVQQRINFARCRNCNVQFSKDNVTFTERSAGKDYEVGIECPNCELWFHSFFLNDELKKMTGTLVNRSLRRAYKSKYDKFNKHKRKQMNMRKLNGRWYAKEIAVK